MSDVFISYARSTSEQAERIAKALRELGYDVWRDDELPAHRAYTDVIEEHLHVAKAVVVIWSAEATKSQWVRAEADVARQAGTLVQLTLDQAPLPLPFNQVQCADMTGWSGEFDAAGWHKVVASVAALAGTPAKPQAPSPARQTTAPAADAGVWPEAVPEAAAGKTTRPSRPPPAAATPATTAKTKGPSPTATEPSRSPLARRIDELAASAAGAADGWVRERLFRALVDRFGTDFAFAHLDRDWLVGLIDREIAELDRLLSAQVNAILHQPALQRLEARWRGLRYLTNAAYESERIKVKFLSAAWTEIVRDLERAADFDQSDLFKKIYQDEFGTPGGEPYGVMVADYEVQHRPTPGHTTDDVSALKAIATVAAAAFCPFILGVSPRVFQLDSFRDLSRPMNLRSVFNQAEYQRWLSVRDGEDMRFVGLAMPRVLIRAPYGPDPQRNDGFRFDEAAFDRSGAGHLWASAAFAFASIVMRAFATSGWFADLRGAPLDEIRGGLVTDLPVVSFGTDRPGSALKPSTECILSEAHERDLADLGFIALRTMPFTPYSVFYANPSLQLPKRFTASGANANAKLSSMLQYMLCISRFAHYIKILGRERIGSTMTPEQCQVFLQDWLRGYCEGSDTASQEAKARSPLREGTVEVREAPGKPGAYACTVFLRPHFQLDDIATGFRLVTELAPPRAA